MFGPDMKMEDPDWRRQDIEFKIAQMEERILTKLSTINKTLNKKLLTLIANPLAFLPLCNGVKTWSTYAHEVFEKSRTLLYGAMYEERLAVWNYERLLVRTQLFANLRSVEEVKDLMLKFKQVLDYIITSTVKLPKFSVSENFRSSVQIALNSQNWEEVESLIIPIAIAFLGRAAVNYDAFLILAVLLLSRVYRYLINLVDRGGGKIYSSGSLEFRSIYISIVLFQGAYIWIKFREVAPESNQHPSPGLYRKSRMNELGQRVYYGNFEPRFKPVGSNNYISVGGYEQEEDAKACYQILAFWFGEDAQLGDLPLEDGTTYHIPTQTKEQGDLDLQQRREWAKRAKDEFGLYKLMKLNSKPVHPTGDALPPDLPERLDVGARVIVQSGRSGVQADDPHALQLCDQGGDLVRPVFPSNYILNVAPGTEGMQHQTFNDSPSDGVGGDEFNFTAPESIARSQPEAVANTAAIGTGESNEQPLEPQRPGTPLQGNQANDSAVNMIMGDLSLQRQVKELQRQRTYLQCQLQCQQLQIQHLETRCSSLETQQEQQQSRMQQMENRFLEFQRHQQHLLLQNQQMQCRIQEHDSRILEFEGANDVLKSKDIARKRRCTSLTPTHDSQN
jgi:hypothetical protein